MRATLLGHACWLIETTAGPLITDPVFFDPFEEGTVMSCPRRQVWTERLPALRGIFVSHRHLDHYDFPSLAVLDRRLPVWCPDEPLLHYGLRHLGFHDLRILQPFVPQFLDGLRLLPTPSLNRQVVECGLVLQDDTGTLFNQVDTFLSPEAIRRLRQETGAIDVHLAMYASQHFGFFESQRAQTAASYALNLNTALMLNAGCVVPASAGFRFVDTLDWLNARLFPIASPKFCADLHRLRPELRTVTVNPGDTLTLADGSVTVQRQACHFVTMLEEDSHRLTYNTAAPIPALVDTNPAGYGLQGLQEFAQGLLEQGLLPYLVHGLAGGETVLHPYLQHEVSYEIEVVFPDQSRFWTYRFIRQQQHVSLTRGASPTPPEVYKAITASALVDFCLGRRSYFAVRTQTRRSTQVVELIPTPHGLEGRDVEMPDLLTHYIVHAMAGAGRRGATWVHWVTKDLRP